MTNAPVTTRTSAAGSKASASQGSQAGTVPSGRLFANPIGSHQNGRGQAHRSEREQEVRHDQQRVEVEDHGQAAQRDLSDDGDRYGEGDPADPAGQPSYAARCDRRDRRARHGTERHDAVSELHEGVEVLLRERGVAAAGPVVAAET